MKRFPGTCFATLGFFAALTLFAACGKDKPGEGTSSGGGGALAIGPGVFTNPAANSGKVQLLVDSARVASALITPDGGTITATAVDGTQFVLTIPKGALVAEEHISVTPVAQLTGLPGDASTVASVQLEPNGLLLMEQGTLEIKTPSPVDRARGIPLAWSGAGTDLHLHPIVRRSASTFQVSHFSGFAIATGGDAAMNAIQSNVPEECGNRIFREINEALAERRRAALMGDETGIADLVDKLVQLAQSYLNDILKPLLKQVAEDDSLLPCAMSEVVNLDRSLRLVAGDSLGDASLSQALQDAWVDLYKAVAASFTRTYDRCKRNESPIFQFQRMSAAARFLVANELAEMLPANHMEMIEECGKTIEYRVDFESSVANVYAMQGRGADFSGSNTTAKAAGIRVVFNEKLTDMAQTPMFTSESQPLDAAVTAVSRARCPNKARVRPGSMIQVTITPVLNPRIGKLICGGGKARCEQTDVNPGVMVKLAPQVVEETWVHVATSSQCMAPTEWGEWMMMFEGDMSTGAFEPFQVPGQGRAVIVRKGTNKRGFASIPAIQTANAVVKANVTATRNR